MKIATWNLARPRRGEQRRRERIRDHLQDIDADVWILTETHAEVSPGSDYSPVATTISDRPQEEGENWTTIWSRFPIERVGSTSDDARAVSALVEPPGRTPMIVYGTVLPWLGSSWRETPAADGQAFGAALSAQLSDWLRLARAYPEAELCVAGDFNQDVSERHDYGSRKNRQALRDALTQANLLCLTADPFDPVRAQASTSASIDHICLSRDAARADEIGLRAWPEGSAPDRSLSDHFGVVADLFATPSHQTRATH